MRSIRTDLLAFPSARALRVHIVCNMVYQMNAGNIFH